MLNFMSLVVLRQLFMKPFTNLFPAKRIPDDLTGTLKAAADGKVALNPPVPVRGRFRGRLNYDRSICIGCGTCLKVCPANALERDPDDPKKIQVHNDRCCFCAQCNDACPVSALSMTTEFAFASDSGRKKETVEKDGGKASRKPFREEWLDVQVPEFLPPERVKPGEEKVTVPAGPAVKSVRQIDQSKCIGCTMCARVCPVGAAQGELKKPHHIDPAKCVDCGLCEAKCPKKAIAEVDVPLADIAAASVAPAVEVKTEVSASTEKKSVREIDQSKCIGCTMCAKVCPVGAAQGELKKPHHIDPAICIDCGACEAKCPKHAISEVER